ncbi:hypothetical protein ES705_22890 [subsurface metagenome]
MVYATRILLIHDVDIASNRGDREVKRLGLVWSNFASINPAGTIPALCLHIRVYNLIIINYEGIATTDDKCRLIGHVTFSAGVLENIRPLPGITLIV